MRRWRGARLFVEPIPWRASWAHRLHDAPCSASRHHAAKSRVSIPGIRRPRLHAANRHQASSQPTGITLPLPPLHVLRLSGFSALSSHYVFLRVCYPHRPSLHFVNLFRLFLFSLSSPSASPNIPPPLLPPTYQELAPFQQCSGYRSWASGRGPRHHDTSGPRHAHLP